MKDLEKYIKGLQDFDKEEPAPGHEERFLAKLDQLNSCDNIDEPHKKISVMKLITWSVGLAAAVALVSILFSLLPSGEDSSKWFAQAGDDPQSVYSAYLSQYEKDCIELSNLGEDATFESITAEAIPMIDQLPEELTEKEKADILKNYYGSMLDAVEEFKKILNE